MKKGESDVPVFIVPMLDSDAVLNDGDASYSQEVAMTSPSHKYTAAVPVMERYKMHRHNTILFHINLTYNVV